MMTASIIRAFFLVIATYLTFFFFFLPRDNDIYYHMVESSSDYDIVDTLYTLTMIFRVF